MVIGKGQIQVERLLGGDGRADRKIFKEIMPEGEVGERKRVDIKFRQKKDGG